MEAGEARQHELAKVGWPQIEGGSQFGCAARGSATDSLSRMCAGRLDEAAASTPFWSWAEDILPAGEMDMARSPAKTPSPGQGHPA
jgi:hypothetical protein